MIWQLDCPLVIFDTETTGTSPKIDRIIQIAACKINPDGTTKEWETLIDPGIPIPPESTEVHRITDEMVKGKKTFAQLAPGLVEAFKFCDYGGFNIRFDLRMLMAEFQRANMKVDLPGRIVDAQKIYHKYHRRTLSDAVRVYLGETHEEAHDAMGDVRATLRVLETQLVKHELPTTVEALHRMFFEEAENGLDPDGKLYWRNACATISFGNHEGTPLQEVPQSYLRWIAGNDSFSPRFRQICEDAIRGQFPVKKV